MGLWGGERGGGLQCWGRQCCAREGGSNGGSVLLLEGDGGLGVEWRWWLRGGSWGVVVLAADLHT